MIILQMGPYPPPHGGVQTNLVAIRRYLEEGSKIAREMTARYAN